MFCIDAEYVLVFLCSVFLLVYTVAERHKANIKKTCSNKCHPFIRFHNFYGFMFFS